MAAPTEEALRVLRRHMLEQQQAEARLVAAKAKIDLWIAQQRAKCDVAPTALFDPAKAAWVDAEGNPLCE